MKFRKYLKDIAEETTSADIATVDNKLGMKRNAHDKKCKKCKEHNEVNCEICEDDRWN